MICDLSVQDRALLDHAVAGRARLVELAFARSVGSAPPKASFTAQDLHAKEDKLRISLLAFKNKVLIARDRGIFLPSGLERSSAA